MTLDDALEYDLSEGNLDGPREAKLRAFVRKHAKLGIAIGPTAISQWMGWNSVRMNSIPGWAAKIRREELLAAGFPEPNEATKWRWVKE